VASYAIKYIDFTVIEGHRGREAQNTAFAEGNSKLRFPHSKHNQIPSLAFDFIPYPFNGWSDLDGFTKIGHMMLGIGAVLKEYGLIENDLIYGGDWESFNDYPHIELR
jgi:peptidoglycan L-alanyl-D-glutamate endopeptidase CwlK